MSTAMLSFEPLEAEALRWVRARNLHISGDSGQDCTVAAIANVLHIERATVSRWRTKGTIDLDTADRLAIELGRHIGDLWSDDDIEFAFVWSSIDPKPMRRLRADALAESRRLRDECQVELRGVA